MTTAISVEHLSKSYHLGQISTGTFTNDLNVWWAKVRGQPNPLLRIGEKDHGNRDGEELWALRDVSFTVQQGQVLGIIGRNGAGKSTLLKILSRVTAPTSGKIKVQGRIASLLEVGTGFHPDLTGRENVYLNGAILGMSRKEIDRKFDEIVDFSEVEKFIDTPVKRYSSGMYVRLAFAVAAYLDPEILVVDEVLAVGDAEFQKKCLGKMGDVAQDGRTVLFVSHNLASIEYLCNRAILLAQGKITLDDISSRVVTHYLAGDIGNMDNAIKNTNLQAEIIFKGIICLRNNSISQQFITNDQIVFEVDVLVARTLEDYKVGLHILDNKNRLVFAFNPQESGFFPNYIEGLNRLRLTVASLPLLEGTYIINLVAYQKGKGIINESPNVASITILPIDNFSSGYPFRAAHGIVFINHSWDQVKI